MNLYEVGVHLSAVNGISGVLATIAREMLGLQMSADKLAASFGKMKYALAGATGVFAGIEGLKLAGHFENAGESSTQRL